MLRPRGFADLRERVVGIFGVGVEGEAAKRRLAGLARAVVLVDDHADASREVLGTDDGGLAALTNCDVVLKSPGVPPRHRALIALHDEGVPVTSALALWLHDTDRRKVVAITGTKGKSTTTSLVTFILNALGVLAHSAGNIGTPPYDPDLTTDGVTVLEVSSYQAVDLVDAPAFVAVTSLGSDHLDWHGDQATYVRDKLSLTRLEGEHVTLVANDPAILIEREQIGGILKITEPAPASLTQALRLRGVHNQRNLGLAIGIAAAVSGRGDLEIIDAIRRHASDYVALEGRLATVRELDGVSFIDDGLATAPLPTVAALDVFADEPVSLIVGGFDRGVEYDSLVEAVVQRTSPTTVIVMPEVGHRIGELLRERGVVTVACDDMDLAVALARSAVATGGVVLLSPAAPSFGRYTNWRERSADFRRAVGELS